jgi:RecB family exonuclease
MTQIFPTSRCVREFYASFSEQNQLLPKAMSVAEFESKAIIVPHKSQADEDTRVLLMAEAANFENFKSLKIEREFLSFLKNSTYLFRFFEELANEKVQINSLHVADTYAEFEEHLSILDTLLKNYKTLLEKQNLYDKITLPSLYKCNSDFINSHEGFVFHLEGFLNRFEYELFLDIAQIVPFKIVLHVNKYTKKMIQLFSDFDIEMGFKYTLNLSTLQIENTEKLEKNRTDIDVRSFSTRTLQCAFVHEKINEFVAKGIAPEDIAIILPDEGFVKNLKEFDSYKNLNFAMGKSFKENLIYKKLEALDRYIRDEDIEQKLRLSRLKIGENEVQTFKKSWRAQLSVAEIMPLLQIFCEEEKDEIFIAQCYSFEKLLQRLGKIEFQKAMKLFLNRLSQLTQDDVSGGKITVMGVLESRGVHFDGVIIVDFNDEFIPKRSKKDMFLSSHVRAAAKLPSKEDRENLQRYFYDRLLAKAKVVAISFTQNDQSMGSRFLDELGLHVKNNSDEKSYMLYLFEPQTLLPRYNPEVVEGSYDLREFPLSASKLKTLLTCKRWFYYRYVLKSREAKLPNAQINEAEIGTKLHDAMHYVLKENKHIDEDMLMIELRRYLLNDNISLEWRYYLDVWLEHLKSICKNEAKRYEQGYRVYELEKHYYVDYKGFKLEGKIDRVDIKEKDFYVIDYKSGKIPTISEKTLEKCTEFQLEFYYLLAQNLGNVAGLYYYELKSGQLFPEVLFEKKLERLDEILKSIKEPIKDFEKCENNATCKNCPFKKLCDREG